MTDLHEQDLRKQIDDLERRAAESALIASLATDPEARLYNTSLAQELGDAVARLRKRLLQNAA
jgi:hypothetical protein